MEFLIELARKHQYTKEAHYCVILHKDTPVAWGMSRLHCEDFSHAETNALYELRRSGTKLRNLCLVVVRIKKGRILMSKPCARCCASVRSEPRISKVLWSTQEGLLEGCKSELLSNSHLCSWHRNNLRLPYASPPARCHPCQP